MSAALPRLPLVVDPVGPWSAACFACGNPHDNRILRLPGDPDFGGAFDYAECAVCGSLAILSPPDDLARYYPDSYYSFSALPSAALRAWLRRNRNGFALRGRGLFGRLLSVGRSHERIRQIRPVLEGRFGPAALTDPAILDVGCGAGRWLQELAECGLTRLTGIDPFMKTEEPGGNPRLLRCSIHEAPGQYDLVIASHSLEHTADPLGDLAAMCDHLAPAGVVMIRIPLAQSFAWQKFGAFWVQLDPPRHFHLFSAEGFGRAARRVGLTIRHTEHDSTEFAILGSEARRRGIGPHSPAHRTLRRTRAEIARARREARRHNAEGNGDQATFYLTRT